MGWARGACEESRVQIIVVSDRFTTAKTMVVMTRHLVGVGFGALLLILLLAGSMSYFALQHATEVKAPFLQDALVEIQRQEMRGTQEFVRDNLKAIASKVGQLQAQMLHLDSLGNRLSSMVGVDPEELGAARLGGFQKKLLGGTRQDGAAQGGPLISASEQQQVTAEDLGREVDRMLELAELQADYLSVLESQLLDRRIAYNRLPTALPVEARWSASAYGWRADPFTGQQAMHEGVDFSAMIGTPITAAANGVVINVENHREYGRLVEIDHGNDYVTRYAHSSRTLVKIGQIVKRGQVIAEVGSTGRSTGPHLHFEVRYKGASVNPSRFLPRKGDVSSYLAANMAGVPY